MKKFFDCGIDLGTTNSCIAKPNMDNTCVVIDSTEGANITPSVVAINKAGKVNVGARAKRIAKPGDMKKEFKRDMGTDTVYTFESSGIQKTPVELSAEVLGQLKRDFESRILDKKVQDVIITVPAAFSLMQCEATKKAGNEAGFRNVILLQEPIAASIAYGAQPDAKEQYWLVFDYGGGTLDVSIISTKDDHLDNINSRGDNRMGGKDLDHLLYEKVILPKMQEEYSLPNGLDAISTMRIMEDVENCKKELSSKNSAEFCPDTLGEVMDEEGEFIDFSCEVTREEFEDAIRDTVLAAVSIARKALTESGIPESNVDRILLVGGSTFVPLVREELQKEFSIKLDCSLNPMTVVAEGAALFAASQVTDEEDDASEVEQGDYQLQFEYNPITSDEEVNICGTITGANGNIKKVKIDCIADENATNALWSSGWSDVLDEEIGAFDIDIRICNKDASNLFKISAIDTKGSEVQLCGYLFEIVHKESALQVMAPPMPHAIGVMANDGKMNVISWFSEKNTKLPISVTKSYILDKALDPADRDHCQFVFFEGEVENACNPKSNHHAGTIMVDAVDVGRKVNKGTEVEITIDIDISRTAKVSAIIPDLGIELFVDRDLEGLGAQVSVMQNMTALEDEIDSTEHTLDMLRKKGVNVGDLYIRFNEIKSDYDKYLDLVGTDDDSVNVYIQKFYALQTEVIRLEMDNQDSADDNDLEDQVRRDENNVNQYGTPEQKQQFQEMKRQMESMHDAGSKQFIAEKMNDFAGSIVADSMEWLKNVYTVVYELGFTRFTDNQKAEYWKNQARTAISNNDKNGLRNAIIQLQNLRVATVGESNNGSLADLRIR